MTEVIEVGFNKIDKFVERQQAAGNQVRWDGWTTLWFYPMPYAVNTAPKPNSNVRPVQYDGVWGFETSVSADADGKWRIPTRSVKSLRQPRR